MNPDTKVTDEVIQAICKRHDIVYVSHDRMTAGFTHEVHRLNDDMILKLFNPYDDSDERRFHTEAAVLGSPLGFKKPRLIAKGEKGASIDRDYVIMSYIPGRSLGSHWHEATEVQREKLISQICQTLKMISQIDPSEIATATGKVWQETVNIGAERLTSGLLAAGTIDAATADRVYAVLARDLPLLADSPLRPVYWDVHFDNFIVDGDFELQAIIDLENVELTPLEYPLFIIDKMMRDPAKFLREEDERYADVKDYAHLWEYYQKYYPEMFAAPNLTERVKLYQLLDRLHLLLDWPDEGDLHRQLDELIA